MDDNLYIGAKDAAAMLGVSVTTLYAYVSRKQIRSHRLPGTRQSRYWKPDIDRLAGLVPDDAVAGSGLSRDTNITLITEAGPFYRGRSALLLADTESFEAVAALLWEADANEAFGTRLPNRPERLDDALGFLAGQSAADRASAVFALIEAANPKAFDLTVAGMCRTGADILRWMTAFLIGKSQPVAEPIHDVIGRHFAADAGMTDLVRFALILAADHGFEPGTYAVRAVASTGVTPYRCVQTGLQVSTGRRTRIGRFEGIRRLVNEIALAADPVEPIVRRVREGEVLPGFGSRLYGIGDPRGRAMFERLDTLFSGDPDFEKFRRAVAAAFEVAGLEPDFLITIVYFSGRLGLADSASLFMLGRSAGWIAHAIEQSREESFIREPSMYRGPLPV